MTSTRDPDTPVQILLVEDSPLDAEIVLRSLRRMGLVNPVQHVKDGTSALDYLLHRPPFEDSILHPPAGLVLLDLNLPRVSGWEVLETIRKDAATRSLPVVVMTSTEWDEERISDQRDPLTVAVSKPVDLGKLMAALRPLKYFSVVLTTRRQRC